MELNKSYRINHLEVLKTMDGDKLKIRITDNSSVDIYIYPENSVFGYLDLSIGEIEDDTSIAVRESLLLCIYAVTTIVNAQFIQSRIIDGLVDMLTNPESQGIQGTPEESQEIIDDMKRIYEMSEFLDKHSDAIC